MYDPELMYDPSVNPLIRFTNKYEVLGNFSRFAVVMGGDSYNTVEHAFQAAKTMDPKERAEIRAITGPHEAKRRGQEVTLREDWEQVKDGVMLQLLRQKFDPGSRKTAPWKLVDTWPRGLFEGNKYRDNYWGCDVDTLRGRNQLGKTLMRVRLEIIDTIMGVDWREAGLPLGLPLQTNSKSRRGTRVRGDVKT